MTKRKILIGLLGLLAFATPAKAQQTAGQGESTMRITLEQAQEYARKHNATMANATLDAQKAELAKWEAITSMLPQVKAGFDYQNMCGYEMHFGVMSIPMNPNGNFAITASVALTGQQIVAAMMSKRAENMSEITRLQNEQSINSSVKNAYVAILVMEQTTGLLDSSLANMERLMKQTEAAVAAGAAEQTDADKLAVQVATIRSSINSTRLSLNMLYNSLVLQLGADVDTKIELATALNELISVDNAAQVLVQNFNIENNYNYQLLQESERLAKNQVALKWTEFAPILSAYYQYSSKTYFGKDEGMNMTPPNVVGASVSLPLFQSAGRLLAIKQQKIAYQETLNSKKQAEDGLKVQYKQLCNNLITALDDYQIQSQNIEVTNRVFTNIAEKYKYGQASSLEVTNASTDMISAQSKYVQSAMSVIQAQVALEDLLNN
ncbi:MAG: TolC family protein [Bacteroidales bacterium]|nr:TolC family protein [Bacteroidales bacterium]